jgi:RNA polymerase sigma factor (sigma-70 family)
MQVDFTNDQDTWILLSRGDEIAYSSLFRKYHPSLVSYGKSLTGCHNVVSDCVQEVFIEIWLYRENLAKPNSVKAYLLSSVRNRIARRLERERIFKNNAELEKVDFGINFTVLDEMISDEETKSQVLMLNKLINQLPERQKEALYLKFHQDLDVHQIADILDINSQSASNLIHRAVKHLRTIWVGEFPSIAILFSVIY